MRDEICKWVDKDDSAEAIKIHKEGAEKFGDTIKNLIIFLQLSANRLSEQEKMFESFELYKVCLLLSKFTNGMGITFIYLLQDITHLALELDEISLAESYCNKGISLIKNNGAYESYLSDFMQMKYQIINKKFKYDERNDWY